MIQTVIKDADAAMNKAVNHVEHELMALRTGRASTASVEHLDIDAYGTKQQLRTMANITTPDGHTILIAPWDPSQLKAIEKAILEANVGLTPNNDGKVIRLNVPPLTEETRKDIVKQAHALAEEGRIGVRNARRTANDDIKKAEKAGDVSEDESKRLHDQVQKETDRHVKKIDELLASKEKDIMTV